MSFANPADLAAYLQRAPFVGAEIQQAQLALDVATSVVSERARQVFVPVTDDTVTLDGFDRDVTLPQRPVTGVTSVTTRHSGNVATDSPTLGSDYEVRGDRLRWVGIGRWPYEVTVVYSHGFATIPDDVKGATLAVAAETYANPEGLASSALDDSNDRHEWSDGSPAEKMLRIIERKYRRKPLSVKLG